jgi:hypothetical protein
MSESNRINPSHSETLGKQVLTGSLATLAVITGEKLLIKMAKHPVLILGLGMLGGAAVYKHRKTIIDQGERIIDTGKAVMLEQKEKFLDLVAETKEHHAQTESDTSD